MEFQAPPGLDPFEVLFDTSEPNNALPAGLLRFAGNLGFPDPPPDRPWVYANFVQSLDGMVTFGGKRPGFGSLRYKTCVLLPVPAFLVPAARAGKEG